ncbi:armadillo-type protein [Gongronella butleri]|nr:armadillo-type protein [Gongronella butleri]
MTLIHERRKQLFGELKSICTPLTMLTAPLSMAKSREATEALRRVATLLSGVEDPMEVLDLALLDAVLLPLLQTLKVLVQSRMSSDAAVEAVLECFVFLLDKTLWPLTMPEKMLQQTLMLFSTTLKLANNANSSSGALESIRTLVIQCISLVLPMCASKEPQSPLAKRGVPALQLRAALADDASHLVLAECAAELCACARDHATPLAVRLLALDTLRQVLLDNVRVRARLAPIYPGIASFLGKIIWQKHEKEHHNVIASAIALLADLTCIVADNSIAPVQAASLHDLVDQWKTVEKAEKAKNDKNDKNGQNDKSDKSVDPWLAQTRVSLYDLLQQIFKLRRHDHAHVRLALVDFSATLLFHCASALPNCMPLCLTTLVHALEDEMPTVSQRSNAHVMQLWLDPSFDTAVVPLLKEGLYSAILQLPRHLMSGDDTQKIDAMCAVMGHARILKGDAAATVLDTTLARATDGWLAALELDVHSLHILDEQAVHAIDMGPNDPQENRETRKKSAFPVVRFKHLVTDASARYALKMLRVLGCASPRILQRWIDQFKTYFLGQHVVPQAVLIVCCLLEGQQEEDVLIQWDELDELDKEDQVDKVDEKALLANRLLLDMIDSLGNGSPQRQMSLVAPSASMASTTPSTTSNASESIETMELCLQLQLISVAAGVLPATMVQGHLMTVLYPLLVHLGVPNVAVQRYARVALDNLALQCAQPNAAALVVANVDYVVNAVSRRLVLLLDHPHAPHVLTALITVTGKASLPYLHDSVDEVFDALKRYHLHTHLCQSLCAVLFETVRTAATATPPLITNDTHKDEKHKEWTVSPAIAALIKDRLAQPNDENVEDVPKTTEEIGKFFLEQRKQEKTDDDLLDALSAGLPPLPNDENDDNDDNDAQGESPYSQEKEETLSRDEQLVWAIVQQAIHFLTASEPALRAKMLQLVSDATRVLAPYPRKLHPLIHDVWPILMHRLDDRVPNVAFYAVQCLQQIAAAAGDFIAQRFVNDVWPRLKQHLQNGQRAGPSLTYSTFSYPHRMQSILLDTLLLAAKHVAIPQNIVNDIVHASQWLLQDHIHPELQQRARNLFCELYNTSPDTLWWAIFAMLEHPVLNPPDSCSAALAPFALPPWMKNNDPHYFANADILMRAFSA